MKALPMLLIMTWVVLGSLLDLLDPLEQIKVMQDMGMVNIFPLDSIPRKMQMPIIAVAKNDDSGVDAIGGGRLGKIKSDAIEYLGEEYPTTGVYGAMRNEAPYLIIFTPTLYFFLVQMPPDMLDSIECRYKLQIIGADGSSYNLFLR
jgi:hypothetical protein